MLGPTLRYVAEWSDGAARCWSSRPTWAAPFVQGVDMLRWGPDGRLTEFTVLVRPVRGLEALIERMARRLAAR